MNPRVAILTTDGREALGLFDRKEPHLGTAPEALLEGFAALPEVQVHVISCEQRRMASVERLAPNIHFHALHVPKIGWLRTGYSGCIRAVRKKLREIRPDIVHGQGTERDCAISAVLSGFPNVVTIHGNMRELARLYRAKPLSYPGLTACLEDFTLPRTGGVFCNSAYTESLVVPRAKRTWRVANPLREIFFRPQKSRTAESFVPKILNVGVITPRKRQVQILAVAKEMHARGLRFEMLFAGVCHDDDAYGRQFRQAIEPATAEGYARHLGSISGEELVETMDTSHAMLHFPEEEAFGLVAAEGLARGMKFFGSKLGGLIDITTGIEGAELIEVEAFDDLRAAMEHWLQKGAPILPQAAEVITARYHPSVIARRHLEIYREVLAAR